MGQRYRNPVHDGYFADPFALRTDEGYVAVGTGAIVDGRAFQVLTSPDLVHWTAAGGALELTAEVTALGTDFWAPEIAARDGRWWMYYSVGTGDVGHHVRVAVADAPAGPYRDTGVDLTPDERFAIDPHPFRADDGTWYLFFARDDLAGERVGTMLAVDVLETPTTVAGRARTILRPTDDWQIFQRARPMYGAVHDWHTLEGPFVRQRGEQYFCFYSGGSWLGETYGVACAVATDPLGPWADLAPGPLLRTVPGHVVGPGHNSLVTTGSGDVMVYHAWDVALTARRLCIDPVRWTARGPVVDGPTWEDAELP